jgi:prepilin signal peptidase PulO-like enzyme (type II secretory pathway)
VVIFSAWVFYGIFIISDGKWIGGGDVKLAIALGLLLGGPMKSIFMVFLAALIGCALVILLMLMKKMQRNSEIAFGPLLMSATFICYLYGDQIIHWYKNFII